MTDKKIAYLAALSGDELTQLPYFKNRGSRFIERCGIDDLQGRREIVFSDVIKELHETTGVGFLTETCTSKEQVVFTVFQWLTTNIGRSVLEEAQEKVKLMEEEYNEQRRTT